MSSLIASSKQHVRTLLEVRKLIYDLFAKCIDPSYIIKVNLSNGMYKCLALKLFSKASPNLQSAVIFYSSKYVPYLLHAQDHRISKGTKPIFHIEAFVAKVLSLI